MGRGRRTIASTCGLIAAIASLGGATGALADGVTSFFALPEATHAKAIVAVADGGIRFTGVHASESREAVVGRVAADGQVNDHPAPTNRPPEKIIGRWLGETVAGPEGNLWFEESFSYEGWRYGVRRIGRISPTGGFTEYLPGKHLEEVWSMATDSAGNLWFTAAYRFYRNGYQAIGRITPSGELTRFRLPPRSRPEGVAAGPDGNIWFVESNPRRPAIGRLTPSGNIKRFRLHAQRHPHSIVTGPDGNLWFAETLSARKHRPSNAIGRITTSGTLTEFLVPGKGYIEKIAAGPTGHIWFTVNRGHTQVVLGSISSTGAVSKPACLEATCKLAPEALAVGMDGTLWFAAGRRASSEGGGGSIISETNAIEHEAGFVGSIAPAG